MTAFRIAALGLLLTFLAGGAALAVYPPEVKDDGKFFKNVSLVEANKRVRAIYEKYQKDVVVETLASLSADQTKQMDKDGKAKFFAQLSLERSRALGVHGVYVLLVKSPQYIQIHMDPQTQKRAFTGSHRTALREKLASRFKEGDFDGGLNAGLELVAQTLEKTAKEATK
ncbi:MAG: TPM domain-containing protein [Gemmataceae bacterium]